ncbi:hypothetical protein S83_017493 [Arachis hypogaea]
MLQGIAGNLESETGYSEVPIPAAYISQSSNLSLSFSLTVVEYSLCNFITSLIFNFYFSLRISLPKATLYFFSARDFDQLFRAE